MRKYNVVKKNNMDSNLIGTTKKNPKAAELKDLMAEEGNNLK
jgi:hypothetical protein